MEEIDKFWKELFIEFQANPCDHRTDKEFCEENKLPESTLRSWKTKNRDFIYEKVNKARKTYVNELRAKNFKEITKAIKDSFNDRKLLAQILGDLVERTESRTEIMDHEQLLRRTKTLLEGFAKKNEAWEEPKNDTQPENKTV